MCCCQRSAQLSRKLAVAQAAHCGSLYQGSSWRAAAKTPLGLQAHAGTCLPPFALGAAAATVGPGALAPAPAPAPHIVLAVLAVLVAARLAQRARPGDERGLAHAGILQPTPQITAILTAKHGHRGASTS